MHFRSILSGTLAVLLVSGAATFAAPHQGGDAMPPERTGIFGMFQKKTDEVRMAQASDPRVIQLEEQIRALNGKMEELNFQILQMQEQMRKIQEDNEFRLQELEKKAGDAGGSGSQAVASATQEKKEPAADAGSSTDAATVTAPPEGGTTRETTAATGGGDAHKGNPPRDFGTITVDKDGNVISSTIDPPVDLLPKKTAPAAGGADVAALPATDDPQELYRNSYQSILSGDYANAEAGFRDHIKRFPSDGKAADSNYWLGEALLGQQKYRDAAEVFLAGSKQYPKASKAPDMLLKLGVSLVGMNQKDVACATFGEVAKRYPNAPQALKQRVKQEQALAAC